MVGAQADLQWWCSHASATEPTGAKSNHPSKRKRNALPGALPGLISASKAKNGHAKAREAALRGPCQTLLSTVSLTTTGQHCHGAVEI